MRTTLVLVVSLVNLVLVTGFYLYAPSYTIKNSIEENLEKYNNRKIVLPEAYSRSWQQVCIFAHGTSPEVIDRTVGNAWYRRFKTNIVSNEKISLLVFINNGRVIAHVQFPRSRADFSAVASTGCFARQAATFLMGEGLSLQLGTGQGIQP